MTKSWIYSKALGISFHKDILTHHSMELFKTDRNLIYLGHRSVHFQACVVKTYWHKIIDLINYLKSKVEMLVIT